MSDKNHILPTVDLEKYNQDTFVLPCVVDYIDYQKQGVIDVVQHKDQLLKVGRKLTYNGQEYVIEKKLKDEPIKTGANIMNRLDYRKVRYYCLKIFNNE